MTRVSLCCAPTNSRKAGTTRDMQLLRHRCAPFAADGHLELFKSTKRYDGVGREQHGYPPPAEIPL